MHVALCARVSTADQDQNPETQRRPLREHLRHLPGAADAGACIDHASADDLRGRKQWRRLRRNPGSVPPDREARSNSTLAWAHLE